MRMNLRSIFTLLASCGATIAQQPDRVIDLSATPTNGGVILTWTAPTANTGTLTNLDVRYGIAPVNLHNWSNNQQIAWLAGYPGTPGTVQNAVVTSLVPGTRYYFALRTQNSSPLWSIASNQALALAGDSTYSIGLSWDPSPSPDVVGYNLYYGGQSRTYTNIVAVGNVTTATISGLPWGRQSFFAATAVDSGGEESIFSNELEYCPP